MDHPKMLFLLSFNVSSIFLQNSIYNIDSSHTLSSKVNIVQPLWKLCLFHREKLSGIYKHYGGVKDLWTSRCTSCQVVSLWVFCPTGRLTGLVWPISHLTQPWSGIATSQRHLITLTPLDSNGYWSKSSNNKVANASPDSLALMLRHVFASCVMKYLLYCLCHKFGVFCYKKRWKTSRSWRQFIVLSRLWPSGCTVRCIWAWVSL